MVSVALYSNDMSSASILKKCICVIVDAVITNLAFFVNFTGEFVEYIKLLKFLMIAFSRVWMSSSFLLSTDVMACLFQC